ncbi:hypothetical protein V6N13_016983 [Hibiscus sabdariffa]
MGSNELAPGERSATSGSNLPGIGSVDKFLEIRVLKVLAEAWLLFLDLAAAQLRWRRGRCYGADAGLSCVGLHVTAVDTSASASRRITTTAHEAFIFLFLWFC